MAKKKTSKRDRTGSLFVTFAPAVADQLRQVCEREKRTPSQQIMLWIEPHLKTA